MIITLSPTIQIYSYISLAYHCSVFAYFVTAVLLVFLLWGYNRIQLMVYGRILYNNIKEYTPKWFPTIPYSQTTKPVFGRQPQVISRWNAQPLVKRGWRLIGEAFKYSWLYQFFIFGLTFGLWATFYYPTLYVYQANNKHRTYEAAITKERAHKKKLRELEAAEETSE